MKKYYIFLLVMFSGLMASSVAGELNPLLESSVKYQNIRIAKILAVDRVLLENDEKIALIGIKGLKPPKYRDVKRDEHGFIIPDTDPTTPIELEALRFVQNLAEGEPVRLEFDIQRRDHDNNIMAYVILPNGKLLNAEVLRAGYAHLKLIPPNMKYADKLRAAYQQARHEMRGLQGE